MNGRVDIFEMADDFTGETRKVRVYLPEMYAGSAARFKVAYLHDGQNMLAHPSTERPHTWRANVALEMLLSEGAISPWLLVAVDHGPQRFADFTPWSCPVEKVEGRAGAFAQFLIQQLKPRIDAEYRTLTGRQDTATVGSSLGGLFSLYLGRFHSSAFGRVGAFSPTVMWCGRELFKRWTSKAEDNVALYLDAGSEERFEFEGRSFDYGPAARDFYAHLKGLGYTSQELCFVLEPGGQHHESDWARRLPFAFRWLLK
jgi:predicted alpha/beta superfamily hydrolase